MAVAAVDQQPVARVRRAGAVEQVHGAARALIGAETEPVLAGGSRERAARAEPVGAHISVTVGVERAEHAAAGRAGARRVHGAARLDAGDVQTVGLSGVVVHDRRRDRVAAEAVDLEAVVHADRELARHAGRRDEHARGGVGVGVHTDAGGGFPEAVRLGGVGSVLQQVVRDAVGTDEAGEEQRVGADTLHDRDDAERGAPGRPEGRQVGHVAENLLVRGQRVDRVARQARGVRGRILSVDRGGRAGDREKGHGVHAAHISNLLASVLLQ